MPFLEEGMMTLLNSIIVVFLLQFLHGLSQLSLVQNSPFSLISDKKRKKGKISDNYYRESNGLWFYKERVLIDPSSSFC